MPTDFNALTPEQKEAWKRAPLPNKRLTSEDFASIRAKHMEELRRYDREVIAPAQDEITFLCMSGQPCDAHEIHNKYRVLAGFPPLEREPELPSRKKFRVEPPA